MAIALIDKDEVNKGIDVISLPTINLRQFDGDELLLIAQFSGHFPEANFYDIVVPTIDRSCFNESAGSRKQTYSNGGSCNKHSNGRLRPSKTSAAVIHRKSIGLTSTSRVHSCDGGVVGIVTEPLSRKKLRQRIQAASDSEAEEEMARKNSEKRSRSEDLGQEGLVGEKRSRSEDLGQEGLVGEKRSRGRSRDTVGGSLLESRQFEVNLRLEKAKQRTGEGDMMERLAKMKGKWSSSERTRKIVDASGFPLGWTVRVGLRYKNGRTMFEYRDWRSPDGTLWSSFKDASAFLLSSIRHDSTSEIVVLLKHGRGMTCEEEMCAAEKKCTFEALRTCGDDLTRSSSVAEHTDACKFYSLRLSEALDETDAGKGDVSGRFCRKQFSRVHVDQSLGGCPSEENVPNLTRPPIGVKAASHVDKLMPEENLRQTSNGRKTHESPQSACYMRSLAASDTLEERHGCCDHVTKTFLPSNEADQKELPSKLDFDPTSLGMEFNANSSHSKTKEPECCSGLLPCSGSTHKCSSCGVMFSTLSKLRRHSRRAEHGKLVKCDVCGRHFSCIASLLGHRVKMGHPRVKRAITDSRRVQPKVSEAVSSLRGSKMFSIVLGLLSDTNACCGCNVDHATVAEKSSSKSNFRSKDMPEVVNAEVRQD